MVSSGALYSGPRRRLVLGIDLGTTFSGISYAIQDPGKEVKIKAVTRFPGQDKGDAAIPTVIWYGADGKVLAAGAEEPKEDDLDDALKVEWFKLLLRPKTASTTPEHLDIPTPKLPPSKDIVAVYSDFYKYLYGCAQTYISQTEPTGDLVWESFGDNVIFVLSHPNGWGGAQQAAMRRAVARARLIPDEYDEHERVCFVSEGEASLQFCLASRSSDDLKEDNTVMVIDAGGGTIDISSYTFASVSPIEAKEAATAGCIFQGSVMVRQRAERYIRTKLAKSKFSKGGYIQAIIDAFDNVPKKRFKGTGEANVPFSPSVTDNDPAAGIKRGKIKLSEAEMRQFFDPGVDAIIQAVEEQCLAVKPRAIKTYFLVGGFASNEYLYTKLRQHLESTNLILLRPDCESKKAVAEGAVLFKLDHVVSARTAKITYGTSCATQFIPFLPSHRERMHKAVPSVTGGLDLPDAFVCILKKGTQISQTTEFRESICAVGGRPREDVGLKVIAHRGDGEPPQFTDEDEDAFSTMFEITANLKDAPTKLCMGPMGPFFVTKVDVVLSLGTTELKAQLAWEADGVERRTRATPIYEDDFAVNMPGISKAVTLIGSST